MQSCDLRSEMNCRDVDTPDPPRLTTRQQTLKHRCIVDHHCQRILVDPNATSFSIRQQRHVEEIEPGTRTREHRPVVGATSVVENRTSPYDTSCTAVGRTIKFSGKSHCRI